MNYNILKGKIVQNGFNQQSFAKEIGITEQALSEKLNFKKPFKQTEMENCRKVLSLSSEEMINIFFGTKVE